MLRHLKWCDPLPSEDVQIHLYTYIVFIRELFTVFYPSIETSGITLLKIYSLL